MKRIFIIVAVAASLTMGALLFDGALNTTTAAGRQCSRNSVVRCGVWSVAEMRKAYNTDSTKGARNIFNGMGLTSAIVNKSTVKTGTVDKHGRVIVGGKIVATDAWSAGRTNFGGNKNRKWRSYGGTPYYISKTSISLRNTASVYVFFDSKGIYQGAVINFCGNPVIAVPVRPKPTPKPKPQPKDITVCRLEDKKYPVTIKENQFDPKKHSKNPEDCKEKPKPQPKDITVCRLEDKKYPVTIKEDEFDPAKHSKDPEDCKTPGISVDKKVDGVEHKQVGVDTEFVYQIRVSNTGDTALKNVVVTDKTPEGVTFLKASHGTIENGVWTHTIANIEANSYADFTITAKVPTYLAGKITNTVCVDAPTIPGNPDDCDDATVEVPEPGKIKVCEIESKEIKVIYEKDYDESKHTTKISDCEEQPPVTPPSLPVLPTSGLADGLLNALGVGALTFSTVAFILSRRKIA